jgi:hypothetical protein
MGAKTQAHRQPLVAEFLELQPVMRFPLMQPADELHHFVDASLRAPHQMGSAQLAAFRSAAAPSEATVTAVCHPARRRMVATFVLDAKAFDGRRLSVLVCPLGETAKASQCPAHAEAPQQAQAASYQPVVASLQAQVGSLMAIYPLTMTVPFVKLRFRCGSAHQMEVARRFPRLPDAVRPALTPAAQRPTGNERSRALHAPLAVQPPELQCPRHAVHRKKSPAQAWRPLDAASQMASMESALTQVMGEQPQAYQKHAARLSLARPVV